MGEPTTDRGFWPGQHASVSDDFAVLHVIRDQMLKLDDLRRFSFPGWGMTPLTATCLTNGSGAGAARAAADAAGFGGAVPISAGAGLTTYVVAAPTAAPPMINPASLKNSRREIPPDFFSSPLLCANRRCLETMKISFTASLYRTDANLLSYSRVVMLRTIIPINKFPSSRIMR